MYNLAEKIQKRDEEYDEATEEIFDDLTPTLEAITEYVGVPFENTVWASIMIEPNGIVRMKAYIFDDPDAPTATRNTEVGIPIDLLTHGSPQDVVVFLKRVDEERNQEKSEQQKVEDITTMHLASLYKGSVH